MSAATALLAAGISCVGVGFAAASTILHGRHHPTPPPGPTPDPVYRPCHTTACAHLTTPHTPTPTGPRCTVCGHTKEDTR